MRFDFDVRSLYPLSITLRATGFDINRTYAKPENSVYHGAIGAVRGFGLGIDQIHSSYYIPHLPGKCVSPN